MATPTGPRAAEARGYYARERRRLKQNEKAFDNAGLFASPFDFGAMALGQNSPNSLQLPANAKIAIAASVGMPADSISVTVGLETFGQRLAFPAGGIISFDTLFAKNQTIQITRGPAGPAGTLTIYFRSKSRFFQFGTATFS